MGSRTARELPTVLDATHLAGGPPGTPAGTAGYPRFLGTTTSSPSESEEEGSSPGDLCRATASLSAENGASFL